MLDRRDGRPRKVKARNRSSSDGRGSFQALSEKPRFGRRTLFFFILLLISSSMGRTEDHSELTCVFNFLACHSNVFSSVQSLSHVQLCNPMDWSISGFLSITYSRSLLKLMSIKSVMPSSHLILCRPLLLLPSVFPSIRVFSNESVLCIR